MKYANDNLKEKEYNYNLSFLKALACIAVIGLHTFMSNARILYYLCGFSVPVFFMASGYLIFGKEKITWKYNLIKIMKIIRLILLWCVLRYCIVVDARFLLGLDTFDYEIEILVEDIIGSFIQRGSMWQFWYLGALILIYLMSPFMQKILEGITNKKVGLICIWGIFVVISVSIQLVSMCLGQPIQKYVIQTFRIWSWVQYFIAGGVVRYLAMDIVNKISEKKHLVMLITVTIVANVYQSTVGKNILNIKFTEYFYDSILTIIWSFLLFTYILRIKLPNKMRKICRKISVLTLGVYIIHPMVVWGVKEILHLDMFYPVIIVFGYVTIASFIIVYIFSKVSLINKLLFTI